MGLENQVGNQFMESLELAGGEELSDNLKQGWDMLRSML